MIYRPRFTWIDVAVMHRLLEFAGCTGHPTIPVAADPITRLLHLGQQFRLLPQRLLAAGLGNTYAQIEVPVITPTVDMIHAGLGVDRERLQAIESSAEAELEILHHQIEEIAGVSINPADDTQVAGLLYDRLQLPIPFWTPRSQEPSVNGAALRRLYSMHPVVSSLRRYREELAVLRAARSLSACLIPGQNRLHGWLNPLGAITGRYSCEVPNFQGLHNRLRHAIIAEEGHVLIEADISQAEFRVLAHFSAEPTLLGVFAEGQIDLHRQTMSLISGKCLHEVTNEERQIGKAVNFGIIYGETEIGLSEQIGCDPSQARQFIEDFFRARPEVKAWIDNIHDSAWQAGSVRTWSGRQRDVSAIRTSDPAARNEAQRQAVNTIIQGTAADLLNMAIVRVHRALPANSRLLLTVHDSVLVDAPMESAQEVIAVLRREMETIPINFRVPMRVEIKMGRTWGTLAAV